MTVNMLIQIDKLVQLLESPVFTCKPPHSQVSRTQNPRIDNCLDLRLQLLEPEKYPYLYKCLYGLLMLLPQSSAFAALKNRLNSVSAIGLLHTPIPLSASSRAYVSSSSPSSHPHHISHPSTEAYLPSLALSSTPAASVSSVAGSYDRPNRLKSRDDSGSIRWVEMMEKFKSVQDKARRSQRLGGDDSLGGLPNGISGMGLGVHGPPFEPLGREKTLPDLPKGMGPGGSRPASAEGMAAVKPPPVQAQGHKSKSSLGNFGRLAGGIGQRRSKK